MLVTNDKFAEHKLIIS